MNKYRDKSDFEINKAVAIARGAEPFHNDGFKKSTCYFRKDAVIINAKFKIGAFDPCNNPADAMPIVTENGISLINDSGKLFAAAPGGGVEGYLGNHLCGYGSHTYSESDNIYRAAMEVFLMMKDAEK